MKLTGKEHLVFNRMLNKGNLDDFLAMSEALNNRIAAWFAR